MTTTPTLLLLLLMLIQICAQGRLQAQDMPVSWQFKSEPTKSGEATLKIKATIAIGWHLYSQHLKSGGPIPTQITYYRSTDYVLVGETKELGDPVRFYEDVYDMQIVWYAQEVSFFQDIRLNRPNTTIQGDIVFMVCNDEMCIPGRSNFSILVNLEKR